jgi:hypothetical protein
MATQGKRGKHSKQVASGSDKSTKANIKRLKCQRCGNSFAAPQSGAICSICLLDLAAVQKEKQKRPESGQEERRAGITLVLEVLHVLTKDTTGNKGAIVISRLNQAILQRDSTFCAKKYGYRRFKTMLKDMQAQGLLTITATSTNVSPKQRRSLGSEGGGSDCLQPASKRYEMPEYDLHHFGRM